MKTTSLKDKNSSISVLVFQIKGRNFGINLGKVRKILSLPKIKYLPQTEKTIQGVFEMRNQIIPLINLSNWLKIDNAIIPTTKVILIEFYNIQFGLLVDSIHKIYKTEWSNITSSEKYSQFSDSVIGTIDLNNQLICLLDYEKIILSVNPKLLLSKISPQSEPVDEILEERKTKPIWIIDDSKSMQEIIKKHLLDQNYSNLSFFTNGKQVLRLIEIKEITNLPELIISDVELPYLNGYLVAQKLKENNLTKEIPIILFSSYFSVEDKLKGDLINIDAQVQKSEMGKLIPLIDQFIFK